MTDTIASSSNLLGDAAWIAAAFLIAVGLFSMAFQKNMIRLCIGAAVLSSGVRLFLILLGYRFGGPSLFEQNAVPVTALPALQFFSMTFLLISFVGTALALSLAVMLCRHYGTLDIGEIRRLRHDGL